MALIPRARGRPEPRAPPAGRPAIRPTRCRRLGSGRPTSQLRLSGIRFGANAGARAFGANDRSCGRRGAGRALRGTGSWKTRGIERSAFDRVRHSRAESSRVRGARRASDVGPRSDPHSGGQQRDPRSDRPDPLAPAGRHCAAAGSRRNFVLAKSGSGRTLELGRSRRTIDHAAAAAGPPIPTRGVRGASPKNSTSISFTHRRQRYGRFGAPGPTSRRNTITTSSI